MLFPFAFLGLPELLLEGVRQTGYIPMTAPVDDIQVLGESAAAMNNRGRSPDNDEFDIVFSQKGQ